MSSLLRPASIQFSRSSKALCLLWSRNFAGVLFRYVTGIRPVDMKNDNALPVNLEQNSITKEDKMSNFETQVSALWRNRATHRKFS